MFCLCESYRAQETRFAPRVPQGGKTGRGILGHVRGSRAKRMKLASPTGGVCCGQGAVQRSPKCDGSAQCAIVALEGALAGSYFLQFHVVF
jgi:hypothetical protein